MIWEERHVWGARRTANMLKDLCGFYIKVGQVFATKTDLVPRQYIEAMKFVFEDCPVTSYQKVQKLLRLQLGISINSTFINFDRRPIASATIAQVHIGIMKESNKRIAIKIQHPGSESLLHNDIGNMLFISQIMECVGLKPPFDHKNVLLEYARQVPKEFDFRRESDLLNSIGFCLSQINVNVEAPQSFPFLCSKKILTMAFVDGLKCSSEAFLNIPRVALHLRDQRNSALSFCQNLLSSYGYQLFGVGVFHSDPHPGNVLVTVEGNCALIDFGQMKVIRDETKLLFARLVVALNNNSQECVKFMQDLGLKLEKTTMEIEILVAYLLFDTRMDIKEAHLSPFDLDLSPELRIISLTEIDSDVFMIIRIISMFRGIILSHGIDLHARKIWYPFAISVLYRNGERIESFESNKYIRSSSSSYVQMQQLSIWMRGNGFPSDQSALFPFAISGLRSTSLIYDAIKAKEGAKLESAFKNFSNTEKDKCIKLIQSQLDTFNI